jgi:hypothetical protein
LRHGDRGDEGASDEGADGGDGWVLLFVLDIAASKMEKDE